MGNDKIMDVSRYCGTEKLRLVLEFVTPCFLGGADGKSAELRAASFKGMIRFWWRALYGAEHGKDILKIENEIFGSANEGKSHASNVRIEINCDEEIKKSSESFASSPMHVLNYLAYGKRKMGKTEDAEYICPGQKFELVVKVSKILGEERARQVFQSVMHFVRYGGVGSKCRNGYGSMAVLEKESSLELGELSLEGNTPPQDYCAFSRDSKIYASKEEFDNWKDALSDIGFNYKEAKDKEKIPQNKRKPKEMFLHISKHMEKGKETYSGQILLLPRLNSKIASASQKLGESMNDITAKDLKGGAK